VSGDAGAPSSLLRCGDARPGWCHGRRARLGLPVRSRGRAAQGDGRNPQTIEVVEARCRW